MRGQLKFRALFCLGGMLSSAVFAQGSLRLRLASYNVENLFDAVHDEDPALEYGKEDFTFLALNNPLKELCRQTISGGFYLRQCLETDWTPERATWKIENAAKVLSYLRNKPDILALSEVENHRVVGALAEKLGYGTAHVTSNSPDRRGIDVAFIFNRTKLRLMQTVEIPVVTENLSKPTRNILRAEFKIKDSRGDSLPNTSLFVYANHWPSQAAPSSTRMTAAKIMQADMNTVREEVRGTVYLVAMGDFNTIPTDTPHPFNDLVTNTQEWDHALVDTEEYSRKEHPNLEETLLPGSYWFGRDATWNRLDRIFVSQNLTDGQGADVVPSSFFILKDERVMQASTPTNGPHAGQSILIPRRFDSFATTQETLGFSDHLPIGIDVKIPL